jgi:hypothetical protein
MRRELIACAMVAALVLAPSVARAQYPKSERTAVNTVYLELGGNGLWYSLNYERILPQNIALRVGTSYMSMSASSGTANASISSFGVPLTASYLGLGGANHKFELGGGILFEKFSGQASSGFGEKAEGGGLFPMATFIAGYRYAPARGGFNFKLALTPVWHPDLGTFMWGGMAFGVGF